MKHCVAGYLHHHLLLESHSRAAKWQKPSQEVRRLHTQRCLGVSSPRVKKTMVVCSALAGCILPQTAQCGGSGWGPLPGPQWAARAEAGGGIVPVVNLRPQQTAPHTPSSHRLQTKRAPEPQATQTHRERGWC